MGCFRPIYQSALGGDKLNLLIIFSWGHPQQKVLEGQEFRYGLPKDILSKTQKNKA